tara:strand:+ start:28251 stop:28394 length:144 start_codon:yes stop_codon:yes gene_type:complete
MIYIIIDSEVYECTDLISVNFICEWGFENNFYPDGKGIIHEYCYAGY